MSILSSCSSGLRACLSDCRQRKCNLKTTVTLNIQGNRDTQMHGRTAVCMCVCSIVETPQRQAYSSLICQDKTETRDTEGNDTNRKWIRYVAKQRRLLMFVTGGSYNTWTDATQTFSRTSYFAGQRIYWPSHGYWCIRLFRPVAYDVLQLSGVWHVVARLVLSQDLHQRTQLQPPLLFRDPVTWDRYGNLSTEGTAVFLVSVSAPHQDGWAAINMLNN